jgi:hypothetical protein
LGGWTEDHLSGGKEKTEEGRGEEGRGEEMKVRNITTNLTETKKIIKQYYGQLYSNHLEEMGNSLKHTNYLDKLNKK